MRKYVFIGILGITITLFVYWSVPLLLKNETRPSEHGNRNATALTIWVYSKEWPAVIERFQQRYPYIEVNVNTFRSSGQLHEELMAAISAKAAPHIAEVNSFFGMSDLIASGAVMPPGARTEAEEAGYLAAASAPFTFGEQLWAMPAGLEIPMLYYRAEMMNSSIVETSGGIDWDTLALLSQRMKHDQRSDGIVDRWRLAIDGKLPWYFDNLTLQTGSETGSLQLWERWVHEYKIMRPLQHHLALSDFINGKAGVFIGSSEQFSTLKKYIGGKFSFDVSLFPGAQRYGVIPSAKGFVRFHADDEKNGAASLFLEFVYNGEVQEGLWEMHSVIPANAKALLAVLGSEPDDRGKTILSGVQYLAPAIPQVDAEAHWGNTMELLERIESNGGL